MFALVGDLIFFKVAYFARLLAKELILKFHNSSIFQY